MSLYVKVVVVFLAIGGACGVHGKCWPLAFISSVLIITVAADAIADAIRETR